MEDKKINSEKKNISTSRDQSGLGFLLLKILFVAILGTFLFFVYHSADAKDVDLTSVEAELKSKTQMTSIMRVQTDRDLMQFIGLTASDYEQVIYYRNTQALAVDELLIIKAKDQGQLAGASDAVQKRIDSQITAYDSYGPEQVKLLKNASVKTVGEYLIYCTAEDSDKYEEVVLNAIQ